MFYRTCESASIEFSKNVRGSLLQDALEPMRSQDFISEEEEGDDRKSAKISRFE